MTKLCDFKCDSPFIFSQFTVFLSIARMKNGQIAIYSLGCRNRVACYPVTQSGTMGYYTGPSGQGSLLAGTGTH